MSDADRIKELEEALAAEKKKSASEMRVAFGKKKNVCVYGLGQRFPVTLYANGWKTLIENIAMVEEFIEENRDQLDWK